MARTHAVENAAHDTEREQLRLQIAELRRQLNRAHIAQLERDLQEAKEGKGEKPVLQIETELHHYKNLEMQGLIAVQEMAQQMQEAAEDAAAARPGTSGLRRMPRPQATPSPQAMSPQQSAPPPWQTPSPQTMSPQQSAPPQWQTTPPPKRQPTGKPWTKGRAFPVRTGPGIETRTQRVQRANAEEAGSSADLRAMQLGLSDALRAQEAHEAQAKAAKTKTKESDRQRRQHEDEVDRQQREYEDRLAQANTRRAAHVEELEQELAEAQRGEGDRSIQQIGDELTQIRRANAVMYLAMEEMAKKTAQAKERKTKKQPPADQDDGEGEE